MESLVTSTINPLAFSFMLLSGILMITLPRKYVLVPFLLSILYMTLGQRIVLMGFNFTIFRVLLVFGFIRIIFRRDIILIKLNSLDKIIILWGIVALITGFLLDNPNEFDNLQHRSGQVFSTLGTYYIFRFYITSIDDIKHIIRILAIIIAPLAVAFLIEKASGRNIFSILGGVPEFTMIRNGRLRCQGPFAHPILAGTLGATLMPQFVALWFEKGKVKYIALLGIISSMTIMITSASSGPLLASISALIALFMWPVRNNMKAVRWVILIVLVTLHMVMKAPIWFLIGRMDSIFGGTGWHRAELIDTAIKHFNEWWLIGTTNTAHWLEWGVLPNTDMIDITNQYILEGVYGGLARMLLFITMIVVGFRGIGNVTKALKDENFAIKFLPWTLGAALFAHTVGFISVAYFDQLGVMWYLLLAIISTLSNTSSPVPVKTMAA
jgi:hypothetical protein